MVRRKSDNEAIREASIQLALDGLNSRRYSSVYQAAKAHGIALSTLKGRWKGKASRAEGRVQSQLLSDAEEKALVQWVSQLTVNGFPPRYSTIREMAEEIRK